MSDSLRIRGQEMQIRITRNNALERTLTAIENLTWTLNVDLIQKGYLGETSDRVDEIFKGTSVELSFDPESSDAFTLLALIRERAARRTAQANAHINLLFTAQFPNGQRPRVLIPDLKFRDPQMSFANRDAYVGIKLNGMAESFVLTGV